MSYSVYYDGKEKYLRYFTVSHNSDIAVKTLELSNNLSLYLAVLGRVEIDDIITL
jgi:hypothetical protein